MICEIVNPSDAYTLRTDNFVNGAVAVAILGNGQYGLQGENGERSPVLFGWDGWFKENHIDDLSQYVREHANEIADILDTVLIGHEYDRREVESALAKMSAEDGRQWLEQRHDCRRSSMNDIGGYAAKLAKSLRAEYIQKSEVV